MKFHHVEAIVAIAHMGSLRAAAETLGKSQPALTKLLKQAESELGAKIFTRAARGVEPTEIGQRIIDRARAIHSEFRKLNEDVRQLQGEETGILHVTVSPMAAVRIIPNIMDRFRRQFPLVHLQVSAGQSPAALSDLRSGETDLLVGPVPGPEERTGLTVLPLLKTPISIITGMNSRYAGAQQLKELVDAEWIMIGQRRRSFGIAKDFEAAGLKPPEPITTSDSINSLLAMIEGSDRVCSFPSLMLDEILPRWQIRKIPILDLIKPVQLGLTLAADRPLTPAGQALADAIVNRAKALQQEYSDIL
ncbi:LysR family transcriptional regulator [Rhizobium sp. L1K21]|uniref:LysR family transcriptional regulator n=1 Tax=Rhizobium sp. L1K21 TaxID=2954933 RepID=UPI0020937BD4|nr:LysR family transcriptional regulator [Rhizobium sp. L1K21]MCO6187930.1 LysR family transcriptional regulator [Rhizobium sp. L1K21]